MDAYRHFSSSIFTEHYANLKRLLIAFEDSPQTPTATVQTWTSVSQMLRKAALTELEDGSLMIPPK
jgi:hypothetical protein